MPENKGYGLARKSKRIKKLVSTKGMPKKEEFTPEIAKLKSPNI